MTAGLTGFWIGLSPLQASSPTAAGATHEAVPAARPPPVPAVAGVSTPCARTSPTAATSGTRTRRREPRGARMSHRSPPAQRHGAHPPARRHALHVSYLRAAALARADGPGQTDLRAATTFVSDSFASPNNSVVFGR